MATNGSSGTGSDQDLSDEELTDFLSLLNELKVRGCSLLLVGDARPELFTRASANLLGDPRSVRYRVLGVTDVSGQSVVERLPSPSESPRPLAETIRVVRHATTPRSVSAAIQSSSPTALDRVPTTQVADPNLDGLESGLVESVEEFASREVDLRPSELRVGLDSLGTLLDHHSEDVVRRCLRTVGDRVRDENGMAHFVLRERYDSERTRTLAADVDAVIEIRSVNPTTNDHDAEQRWHVRDRDLTTNWVRL